MSDSYTLYNEKVMDFVFEVLMKQAYDIIK